ncbi:hypothetical protein LAZ67_X002703 [Cordylochernes scorpioides]|uniref:Uncharacterized protein n=1 Tax=Cordylochernes scorpioides TaxID=51811 RepID=A0ABY6LTK9_9ARAC|nr:hypothetical protein LAZ67_X002703 [Cordylochernes scorpioides]
MSLKQYHQFDNLNQVSHYPFLQHHLRKVHDRIQAQDDEVSDHNGVVELVMKHFLTNWISYKSTIIKAAKVSIPRGNIKKRIPNYTHQVKIIQTLITKRNELQKSAPKTKQIVELN